MREYLDLEFQEIEAVLPFDYNLERIIDDFILLAVFIGNDFLPHLPDVHIHENGLERLFEIYKQVLPSLGALTCGLLRLLLDCCLDGYLNENGTINTVRLQILLDRMQEWEQEIFQREYSDMNWIKGKQHKHSQPDESTNSTVGWLSLYFCPSPAPAHLNPSSDDTVTEDDFQPGQGIRARKPFNVLFRAKERQVIYAQLVPGEGTSVPHKSCSGSPPDTLLGRV